jgi:hypothetical protein
MHRAAFDRHPDYGVYVSTDAEARSIAREVLHGNTSK